MRDLIDSGCIHYFYKYQNQDDITLDITESFFDGLNQVRKEISELGDELM
jgi:hypothetical protein